jgi:hypothetical protein
MTGAKYNETYKKVSTMGEKLKAAGKQGPSNDEQLHVRSHVSTPRCFKLLSILQSTRKLEKEASLRRTHC